MDFAKEFNARTAFYEPSIPVPCLVTVKPNRTFTFEIKSPHVSWLLFRAAGVVKGAGLIGQEIVGTVNMKQVYEIAKIKQQVRYSHVHRYRTNN